MSLRILGGSAKGRALQVPESARPSSARIRKSLFDLLASRAPADQFPDFLDLHGGSGAVGLEAASRGYAVTLTEMDPRAVKALEANARALDLPARVVRGDALSMLPRLGQFDVVFSDPPYEADIPGLTRSLFRAGVVRPGGVLICQHPDRVVLPEAQGYERELREYGSNSLTLYWRAAPLPDPAPAGAATDQEAAPDQPDTAPAELG
ncbi:RsmD family RNA methyltransferase [Deinococcus sp. Leaf326]|uniref:RsmD family RNA methyltransferase n=1 Tax=Deinococcus sp. Leaf326 TaxID=1736338 RepID=UPI000A719470|nr:RsmD family RNA methyltransferase [Deinococcus sp. Leaf326]